MALSLRMAAVAVTATILLAGCSGSQPAETHQPSTAPVPSSKQSPTPSPTATPSRPDGGYGTTAVFVYQASVPGTVAMKDPNNTQKTIYVCDEKKTVPIRLLVGLPGVYNGATVATSVWEDPSSDRSQKDTRLFLIDSTKQLDVGVLIANGLPASVPKQTSPVSLNGVSVWRITVPLGAFGFSTSATHALKTGDVMLCANKPQPPKKSKKPAAPKSKK